MTKEITKNMAEELSVYKVVSDIRVSIARIEENLKNNTQERIELIKRLELAEQKHDKDIILFEGRLKKLEEWQWKSIGIIAGATGVISFLVNYFIK